jgi:hypothetical protein
MQHAPSSEQQRHATQHAACSEKYATHIKQRATRNMQHAPDFVQHAANNHDM